MVTDDERRRVAAKLREYASFGCEDEGDEECLVDCADWGERVLNILDCGDMEGECYAALADLIEPAPTGSDTTATHADASATRDMSQSCRDTVASDPTERGIDSIYDWCFSGLEGADGAEDYLYCSIMSAIEEYRHPERVTASTARPVDRGALLALAAGLEADADRIIKAAKNARFGVGPRMSEAKLDANEWRSIARRIREACREVAS